MSQSVTRERDLQLPETVYLIWSGLPRHVPVRAHSSGQVLTLQGKSCSLFSQWLTDECIAHGSYLFYGL